MKKIKLAAALLLSLFVLQLSTGCYGSFKLTKKVYDWNGTVGDKFVNEVVFLALTILPVYEATLLVDGLLLNAVEFWTGNNPMAMNGDETQFKLIEKDGETYQFAASKNRMEILKIGSEMRIILKFNPDDSSFYYESENGDVKVAEINSSDSVDLYLPKGKTISFNPNNNDKNEIQKLLHDNLYIARR